MVASLKSAAFIEAVFAAAGVAGQASGRAEGVSGARGVANACDVSEIAEFRVVQNSRISFQIQRIEKSKYLKI